MASLLCAANFASASVVHTTRTPLFTNHGIHPTTRLATRAWPTHSCSLRLPVLRASSQGSPTVFSESPNDDCPKYGPPAMMLMGVSYSEILKGVQGVPHICIFSGLSDDDIMLLVMTFLDADMELAFKVMTPNNAQKTLEELLWEHERKFSNGEVGL